MMKIFSSHIKSHRETSKDFRSTWTKEAWFGMIWQKLLQELTIRLHEWWSPPLSRENWRCFILVLILFIFSRSFDWLNFSDLELFSIEYEICVHFLKIWRNESYWLWTCPFWFSSYIFVLLFTTLLIMIVKYQNLSYTCKESAHN